jgi:hypothetical protein
MGVGLFSSRSKLKVGTHTGKMIIRNLVKAHTRRLSGSSPYLIYIE